MPGDIIRYDLTNISNASNVELEDFYVRDMIPTDALRLEKMVTGRWSERLTYRVEYKTNYKDWRTLKSGLSILRADHGCERFLPASDPLFFLCTDARS